MCVYMYVYPCICTFFPLFCFVTPTLPQICNSLDVNSMQVFAGWTAYSLWIAGVACTFLSSRPSETPMFHMGSLSKFFFSTVVPEANGLPEASLAKRLRGTPERIELENYRLSLLREEELEEVPEETLAEHNLSSVLDKATDIDLGSR